MFVNTMFVNNVARSGGALQLAGTASIIICLFEGNVADSGGGPAAYNIGYISELINNTVINNIPSCETEYFLNFREVSHS